MPSWKASHKIFTQTAPTAARNKDHMSKGDTSVTSLKNSDKQDSIILEKDEVDSIYEKDLKNVLLSEGILKEGMIDKANESPWDNFPLPLDEVDTKSSKVKPSRRKVDIIDEQITFTPRTKAFHIKDPTKKHMCKGDTSVTSLKNSNKQELITLKKDELDSIYEKNLKNVLLSEGILKEGIIDEFNELLRDKFPLPLAEVDTKTSKVKPASKKFDIIDEQITFIPRTKEFHIKDPTKKHMSKGDTNPTTNTILIGNISTILKIPQAGGIIHITNATKSRIKLCSRRGCTAIGHLQCAPKARGHHTDIYHCILHVDQYLEGERKPSKKKRDVSFFKTVSDKGWPKPKTGWQQTEFVK